MNKYELMVILSADADEEQRKANLEKTKETLTSNGIEITNTDDWGVKKYAYPINYKKEGHYAVMTLNAPAESIKIVTDLLNLNETVVRFMFTKRK